MALASNVGWLGRWCRINVLRELYIVYIYRCWWNFFPVATHGHLPSNNNNFPPLRELLSNQEKLMDNLSKKMASNDNMLENINNRMDNFSTPSRIKLALIK